MRIVLMRGQQYELLDARRFPGVDEVVQRPVERLLSDRRVPGEAALGLRVDAVFDGRGQKHREFGGEIACQPLDDDRVDSEWEMRPVLLTGADGNDQSRIA